MNELMVFKIYLIPTMIQIAIIALLTFLLRKIGITIGYDSSVGIVLIIIAGMSSALWGVVYQCSFNKKRFGDIVKDFFSLRQSITSYLLVIVFLIIVFGGTIINRGFIVQHWWLPVLLFLKALAFGGIEEIGWRYTFQPIMEHKVTYIPAVLITFICWGIWHFLFFYIDGSLTVGVNVPFFLLGLLTNCFILSALYAYSGSLWICVMTHALINALSQIAVDNNSNIVIGIILKVVCITLAIVLYFMAARQEA